MRIYQHRNQVGLFEEETIERVNSLADPIVPPVVVLANEIAVAAAVGEPTRKKNTNLDCCEGCGERVVMLPRAGFKLAWTEATFVETKADGKKGAKRIKYWCQECSENRNIPEGSAESYNVRGGLNALASPYDNPLYYR